MEMRDIFRGLEETSASEHYKKVMNRGKMPGFDPDEYPPIKGLEGPFRYRSGAILYYDPKEGKYYDSKRDIYLSNREAVKLTEQRGNMITVGDGAGPIGIPTEKRRGIISKRRKAVEEAVGGFEQFFLDQVDGLLGFEPDTEPEEVFQGPEVVGEMDDLFEYLIQERITKVECPHCNGEGGYSPGGGYDEDSWRDCRFCDGEGEIPADKLDKYNDWYRKHKNESLDEAIAAVPKPMGHVSSLVVTDYDDFYIDPSVQEAKPLTGYSAQEAWENFIKAIKDNETDSLLSWYNELLAHGVSRHAMDSAIASDARVAPKKVPM